MAECQIENGTCLTHHRALVCPSAQRSRANKAWRKKYSLKQRRIWASRGGKKKANKRRRRTDTQLEQQAA